MAKLEKEEIISPVDNNIGLSEIRVHTPAVSLTHSMVLSFISS
jgi:hypothetical protein